MSLHHFVLLAIPLPWLFPFTICAQEVQRIPDEVACSACEITLEHVLTLGEREGPGRVMRPHAIVRDSKGNYLVAHGDGAGAAKAIWVFDRDGAFVRTVGQEGEGPGEYRGIGRIEVLPGDTLWIYDRVLRRRTTLSPNFDVIATQSYETGSFFHSVLLPDGRIVVNEHLRSPERVGYPLQLVGTDGRIVRSFGATDPEYRRRQPVRFNRMLFPGPDNETVWSVGRGDYLLELWDTTGTRKAALKREADWFVPFVADGEITPSGPPPPTWLRLVKDRSQHEVWVIATAPKANWREVASEYPNIGSNLTAIYQLYDSIIELLDLSQGRLVASQLLHDIEFSSFLGNDHLVSYREDEDGYPFLDIWRLSLAPPTTESSDGLVARPGGMDVSPVPRAGITPLGSYPASPEGSSY